MSKNIYNIMIVAGEASGDLHAAKLVSALKEMPQLDLSFFGSAGPKMRVAGVEPIVKADHLSIVGLPEIARALPMFVSVFNRLKRAALDRRPDVVVLVDFPDFNLKLAKSLHKRGFKIVYYISPQLWAWRRYRIRTVRKYIDLLISILPFEKGWYAEHGVDHVDYVGSPLAREVHSTIGKDEFCRAHRLDPNSRIVALLPGSRHKEIIRILPIMLETAGIMTLSDPSIQFIVAVGSDENRSDVDAVIEKSRREGKHFPTQLITVQNETFNALNASDVAAVASGTATLETGIIGTPMAIVYSTSTLNFKLLRPLIDVEHFGLINLIAGERVAAELIQDEFSPQSLERELFRLLDSATNHEVRRSLEAASEKLGRGGASRRAAEAIVRVLEN